MNLKQVIDPNHIKLTLTILTIITLELNDYSSFIFRKSHFR